ncbi:MAG: GntR family transcriptional regulator [Thermoleophilia bacterium]|nr:GntR family transcriptional regulator [Thermoleophilia bacterium]
MSRPARLVPVDRAGPPAHVQIEERLADLVLAGGLTAGHRLPPERELAAELGVSRMTLRQALGALERRGFVSRFVGRRGGTFVAAPRIERDLTAVVGFSRELRRQGVHAGARVLAAGERPAGRVRATALALQPRDPVYEVVRVRLANGEPVALERSAFPARRFPGLLEQPLEGSLYELLGERYGERPRRAVERLEAVAADERDADALAIPAGSPLMRVERTAYGARDAPVEYAHDIFRGDRMRAVVSASRDARAD